MCQPLTRKQNKTMASKTPLLTLLMTVGLLAGCEQANVYAPPPPPKVSVATPLQQGVTEYLEQTEKTEYRGAGSAHQRAQ